MDYYLFIDPGEMEGRVGLVGRHIADSLPNWCSLIFPLSLTQLTPVLRDGRT